MIPFMLFFTIILLVFSCAIQMYFQLLPDDIVAELQPEMEVVYRDFGYGIGNVMMELLIAIVGEYSHISLDALYPLHALMHI